jgi:ADP-ribose pyrophosphatase YjhB (NUDIX family)
MVRYYSEHERFLVAVDAIIFGFDGQKLKLLLVKRNFPPSRGEWSLMGGFLKKDESLDDAAVRVLHELTGLGDVYLEQLQSYGDIRRDPGERVISVAYYALIKIDDYDRALAEKYHASWFHIDRVPTLIFDHNEMVAKALRRLRRKAQVQPVGFELLPETFTLPQLQKLYEAIFQKDLDKRNFRKKILGFDVMQKLPVKDKEGSRKGAYLYRFDRDKYEQLLDEGTSFVLKVT